MKRLSHSKIREICSSFREEYEGVFANMTEGQKEAYQVLTEELDKAWNKAVSSEEWEEPLTNQQANLAVKYVFGV